MPPLTPSNAYPDLLEVTTMLDELGVDDAQLFVNHLSTRLRWIAHQLHETTWKTSEYYERYCAKSFEEVVNTVMVLGILKSRDLEITIPPFLLKCLHPVPHMPTSAESDNYGSGTDSLTMLSGSSHWFNYPHADKVVPLPKDVLAEWRREHFQEAPGKTLRTEYLTDEMLLRLKNIYTDLRLRTLGEIEFEKAAIEDAEIDLRELTFESVTLKIQEMDYARKRAYKEYEQYFPDVGLEEASDRATGTGQKTGASGSALPLFLPSDHSGEKSVFKVSSTSENDSSVIEIVSVPAVDKGATPADDQESEVEFVD
ncbi:hypothetical protein CVT26_000455 [Gymnopilus dilepis]|uniref:Uncharacterized protein n=1 Tax=Gymnopilus dilepis TaxID=231916 RepID=A0A409WKW1_9AGAR|nr:hypothetical protein CVT26_000455 [Gymnopilus dilepis]